MTTNSETIAALERRIENFRRERNELLLPRISMLEAEVASLGKEITTLVSDRLMLMTALKIAHDAYVTVQSHGSEGDRGST